jgi:hypothetical protein
VAHAVIASILSTSINALDLELPKLTAEKKQALEAARRQLESEVPE